MVRLNSAYDRSTCNILKELNRKKLQDNFNDHQFKLKRFKFQLKFLIFKYFLCIDLEFRVLSNKFLGDAV